MARQPGLWFRKQTGWWCTTVDGEQVKLSQDKKEAQQKLYELLSGRREKAETVLPTFRKIGDLYLGFVERTMAPSTFQNKLFCLRQFREHVGKMKVQELRPHHVSAWLDASPGWNETTRSTYRSHILACLNWAVEEGHLRDHPLGKMKTGDFLRRERILSADEKARIRGAVRAKGDLADFLLALELTGARPFSEMAAVTAGMIDWASGTIPLKRHKNAKKKKKRTIYITPELEALLRRKCGERPEGPLFVTRLGNAWSAPSLCYHLKNLEEGLKIEGLIAYSWRHTFITDALAKGLTADLVAELVGNSPQSIAKYYSHLESKREVMKEAARKAVG